VTVKLMFVSVALLLVAGCTRAAVLANTTWTLTSFGQPGAETPVLAGSRIILEFESSDEASGSAGCNRYRGRYQIRGSAITFSDIGSTLRACARPGKTIQEEMSRGMGLMWQEEQYLAALRTTGRFELVADSLTIFYSDGKGVLRFTRSAPSR